MGTVGVLLILGSLGLLFVALVCVVKPFGFLGFKTRKRAGHGLLGAFGLLIVGTILISVPTTEERDAQRIAAEQEAVRLVAEAEAQQARLEAEAAAREARHLAAEAAELDAARIAEEEAARIAEEEAAREEAAFERLMSQMDLLKSDPCATDLYFFNAFGWMITCENCSAVRANTIYPEALIENVDRWAVNNRITVTDFLETFGQC